MACSGCAKRRAALAAGAKVARRLVATGIRRVLRAPVKPLPKKD